MVRSAGREVEGDFESLDANRDGAIKVVDICWWVLLSHAAGPPKL